MKPYVQCMCFYFIWSQSSIPIRIIYASVHRSHYRPDLTFFSNLLEAVEAEAPGRKALGEPEPQPRHSWTTAPTILPSEHITHLYRYSSVRNPQTT